VEGTHFAQKREKICDCLEKEKCIAEPNVANNHRKEEENSVPGAAGRADTEAIAS